eukprot:CAMPEP_0119348752 /NCGR_PEP_ID=MMETSP1333-20130426/109205_1 /TAXON_ID=418940 /ORGANISM="Scyphosphaera apsteinii, Strain RCC1455" /LENGTH=288 /DNA_ID=CAMNT_0007361343 /DNA_START=418 /DNA_END=1281 /DNA_ORIENTATION=-
MWVLLYQPKRAVVVADEEMSFAVEAGVCLWGDQALRIAFPQLAIANDTHQGLKATRSRFTTNGSQSMWRYYWFHASLVLWNLTFGVHFPRVTHWWRIEPDTLFAGGWPSLLLHLSPQARKRRNDSMLEQARHADVLLPHLITSSIDIESYPHWKYNLNVVAGVPRRLWTYSLVSIGRYSVSFMHAMTERWAQGTIGYEEILLPLTCVQLGSRCLLRSLHRLRPPQTASTRRMHSASRASQKAEARIAHISDHFRYRPPWRCEAFLRAAAAQAQGLWHPVKNRKCWVDW